MPTYRYKGKKSNGTLVEETASAKDKFSLYRSAKGRGVRVIHAEELSGSGSFWSRLKEKARQITTVSKHDVITFARNLGLMLEAGLSLSRALSVLRRQASNARFKKIIGEVEDDISGGKQLYEGLERHSRVFSSLFVSMVKAGEESGNLAQSLKTTSDQMNQAYELTKKVRGALIYPAIIVVIMIAIGILALVYIVPTLTATFEGLDVDLPLSTQVVIGISDFMRGYAVFNILGAVLSAGLVVWFFKTAVGRRVFDFLILHLPVVSSIVKQVNSARTTRTLASLLSSGVDYVVAISITRDVVQNTYYKDVLELAEDRVEKGDTISSILSEHEKLYPIFVIEMASVGEETGQIAEMFENTAEYYEGEVALRTKNMSTIIEPVLMVVMGVAVGLFALSMLSPMYSLVDAI